MRNDLEFNLENVDCSDLAVVLYKDIVRSVKNKMQENSQTKTINFVYDRSFYQTTKKKDGKEYAQVFLDFGSRYAVVVDPFSVKILLVDMFDYAKEFTSPELRECLHKFMLKRFPNSDYEKKRAEYFGESLSV